MAGAGSTTKVHYGREVVITGRVSPGTAGRVVRLDHAAAGSGYGPVASARTAGDGSYRFAVRPRRSGSYRAVSEGQAASPRRVTVIAAVADRARKHVLGMRPVAVKGRLLPALGGRRVTLQLRTRRGWRTLDRSRTRRDGRFSTAWRPRRAGGYRVRVRFGGDSSAAAASSRSRRVYVYRAGHASWYGPGFYGNRTACGGTLGSGTLGVAHKWLPCGTKVTFRYRGRSATVRVIDRGPFIAGREWDLTGATKRKLGFGSTGTVWSTR
jgi:rare lipoprotein A